MKLIIVLIITNLFVIANSNKIITVDSGVKRVIAVDKDKQYKGFIIDFKDGADVNKFVKKYKLVIKKKMVVGYWVLENKSKVDDATLLVRILKDDIKIIESIRPNWAKMNLNR